MCIRDSGKPYVMEMILPLDASARSTLNSNELIYRDALTGAYGFILRNNAASSMLI